MNEIKVLVFVLCTFFQTEEDRIFAEKATVTIDPLEKIVEINLEDPFTIVKSNEDFAATRMQYDSIVYWSNTNTNWSKDLDHFVSKELHSSIEENLDLEMENFKIILNYEDEKDLEAIGIWFNTTKNKFAINNTPDIHMTSETAEANKNYWYFDAEVPFGYILKPFANSTANFSKNKVYLKDVLDN
jgi:hypothetical protein